MHKSRVAIVAVVSALVLLVLLKSDYQSPAARCVMHEIPETARSQEHRFWIAHSHPGVVFYGARGPAVPLALPGHKMPTGPVSAADAHQITAFQGAWRQVNEYIAIPGSRKAKILAMSQEEFWPDAEGPQTIDAVFSPDARFAAITQPGLQRMTVRRIGTEDDLFEFAGPVKSKGWLSDRHFFAFPKSDNATISLCDVGSSSPHTAIQFAAAPPAILGIESKEKYGAQSYIAVLSTASNDLEYTMRVRTPREVLETSSALLTNFQPSPFNPRVVRFAMDPGEPIISPPNVIERFSVKWTDPPASGALEGIKLKVGFYDRSSVMFLNLFDRDLSQLAAGELNKPIPPENLLLSLGEQRSPFPGIYVFRIDCDRRGDSRTELRLDTYVQISSVIPNIRVSPEVIPCVPNAGDVIVEVPQNAGPGKYPLVVMSMPFRPGSGAIAPLTIPLPVYPTPKMKGAIGKLRIPSHMLDMEKWVVSSDWIVGDSPNDNAPLCVIRNPEVQSGKCRITSHFGQVDEIEFDNPARRQASVFAKPNYEGGGQASWIKVADWAISPNHAPDPVGASPFLAEANSFHLTASASDEDGAGDIAKIEVRIAAHSSSEKACEFSLTGAVATIEAANCSAHADALATRRHALFEQSARVDFTPALRGRQNVYIRAVDRDGLRSDWLWAASWLVH